MDSIKNKNVILCGFMGCGKTTAGMMLAEQLGLVYVDTDEYISKKSCMSVEDIFLNHGEDYFRKLEKEVAGELSTREGQVIAAGGGMFIDESNATVFKDNGVLIYINTPFTLCFSRIENSERPLVRANTREDLSTLYRQRRTVYRNVADFELDGVVGSSGVVAAILDKLSEL